MPERNARAAERRRVRIGHVPVGGGAPVSVQGMTKCDSHDEMAVIGQVFRLVEAGCEIVRVAIPDRDALRALAVVVRESPVPIVADVHFDHGLALGAIDAGVHKVRVNPGNIGGPERLGAVAAAARDRGVPLRVGVNSGSLERDLLERYGGPTAEAMVESARRHVETIEDLGFRDIVISLKSSHVPVMVRAYRLAADLFPYPLHVGVTETGAGIPGVVKSAAGIGALLLEGIGDTIRVSLTGDPVEEVLVAREILVATGLRRGRPEIVSCPTCGRCSADIEEIVREVRRRLERDGHELTVAVMGCEVNGPGEARDADVGIAFGKGRAALFVRGTVVKTVPIGDAVDDLVSAANGLIEERERRHGSTGGPPA